VSPGDVTKEERHPSDQVEAWLTDTPGSLGSRPTKPQAERSHTLRLQAMAWTFQVVTSEYRLWPSNSCKSIEPNCTLACLCPLRRCTAWVNSPLSTLPAVTDIPRHTREQGTL
jgi:hypothetical protein